MMDVYRAKEVLGIAAHVPCTTEVVRTAFRRASMSAHPDQGGQTEAFQMLTEARDTLMEVAPIKRGKTNRSGGIHENRFTELVQEAWRSIGALTLKVHGSAFQAAGWPDLQVYHPRWTGHLELKVDDNELERMQRIRIKDLQRLGANAWVLRHRATGELTVETAFQEVVARGVMRAGSRDLVEELVRLLGTAKGGCPAPEGS